jgi:hypothetical protein
MIENLLWTGDPEDAPEMLAFLRQGTPAGVSYRLEPAMDLSKEAGATLCITHRGNRSDPVCVKPGQWVHFDGARFGPGQRAGGKR